MKPDTIIMRRAPILLAGAACPHVLVPQDHAGGDLLAKIPLGEDVAVKIMRDRSLPQHRLFWAVLRYVAEATKWRDPEKLLATLKWELGRFDLVKTLSGKVIPMPESISFAAMTQDAFQDFMDKSIALICSEVLPGMDSDRLIAEAQAMLG